MSKEQVIAELESLLKWLEDGGEKEIFSYPFYGMCHWVEVKHPDLSFGEDYLTDVLGLSNPRQKDLTLTFYWWPPNDPEPRIALVKARIEELKQQ